MPCQRATVRISAPSLPVSLSLFLSLCTLQVEHGKQRWRLVRGNLSCLLNVPMFPVSSNAARFPLAHRRCIATSPPSYVAAPSIPAATIRPPPPLRRCRHLWTRS